MGELIVLPRAERPVQPVSSLDRTAEILFFTGVRYHRMTEEEFLLAGVREAKAERVKTRRRRRSSAATVQSAMRIDVHA